MRVFITYMNDCSDCLDAIIKAFQDEGEVVIARERSKVTQAEVDKADFIVVLAGDGTFLKTAHFADRQPMVGVNATPHRRVGFFCRATPDTVLSKFRAWKRGKLKPVRLMRLESTITHKGRTSRPFLCLNELYVGCARPFHVSRYVLRAGDMVEYQKTSGLLVSTPAGSTAWTYTAGGRKLPLTSRKIQFVAREAVQSNIVKMDHTRGVLPQSAKITVISDMADGVVVVDSYPSSWKFPKRAKLTIKASKKDLFFIK